MQPLHLLSPHIFIKMNRLKVYANLSGYREGDGFIVSITKLKDTKFEGQHPNKIYEGYTRTGYSFKPPTVGERFDIFGPGFRHFSTSPVTKVLESEFHTQNSIYSFKIEEDEVS